MTPDAGSNPDASAFFRILLYRSPRIWYNGSEKDPGVVERRKTEMDYRLGDMIARYTEDAEGRVGLLLFPADCPVPSLTEKKAALDPPGADPVCGGCL